MTRRRNDKNNSNNKKGPKIKSLGMFQEQEQQEQQEPKKQKAIGNVFQAHLILDVKDTLLDFVVDLLGRGDEGLLHLRR